MKLNGFRVKMLAVATCPKGHHYEIPAELIIGPCEEKDISKWANQAEYYFNTCWSTLENTECQSCKADLNTKWSPF